MIMIMIPAVVWPYEKDYKYMEITRYFWIAKNKSGGATGRVLVE